MNKIKSKIGFEDLSEYNQDEIRYQLWEQYKNEHDIDPKLTLESFEYMDQYASELDEYINTHFKGEIEY